MTYRKRSISLCLLLSLAFLNFTLGWRWETADAIIQDVWPESGSVKFKRASSATPATVDLQVPPPTLGIGSSDQDEDENLLVFEGRYFKPNEVPPPPPFMVGNNWHGGSTSSRIKPKQPQSKNTNFYYLATVGTGSTLPPVSHKFTEENAKDFVKADKVEDTQNVPKEERIASSNSKNVIASTSVPHLEDLHYYEEHSLTGDEFHDAPKCYTATDAEGRCLPFKNCYPVVFNVIDGNLRNPGLAKLLYQSSGPCNATLEIDFALNNKKHDKSFYDAKFYNQSICCPKFKHPPTLLRSREDDGRSTRLINDEKQILSPAKTLKNYQPSAEIHPEENEKEVYVFTAVDGSNNRPLEVDDSSVEISLSEYSPSSNENEGGIEEDLIMGDNDSRTEDENIRIAVDADVVKVNSSNQAARTEDAERDALLIEDRRGDREKESSHSVGKIIGKKPTPDYIAIPAPDLSPNKCRHQIYGMPRGHWPWMVALVISSRHICSGALIDERHVVTAAHCVYLLDETNMRKLRVIIGDRVMYSSVDGPHFWRKVTKITTHLNYNQQTFASDIAILKLNSDVPFSRNVQPISLSDLVTPVDSSTFSKGIVAGWSGADIGQASFEARTEMETVVDIMDKEECREVYRGFALSGVATNTFCTKAANNTCVADSGAPLIVRVQNCWVLAGIMSWGLGCSHFPEVFTDVTRYTSWIRKHVA